MTARQEQVFLDGEGLAWLKRNRDKLPVKNDLVTRALLKSGIKPRTVLEVGCADGWRLHQLKKKYMCDCHGIDPSIPSYHTVDGISLYRGVASSLHLFKNEQFDLVIYGFCLYLCDPETYFDIAAEGNRVLADNGYIIVYDFYSQDYKRVPYQHKAGLFSHKMDFQQLWAWHPYYAPVGNYPHEKEQVTAAVLHKDISGAFA